MSPTRDQVSDPAVGADAQAVDTPCVPGLVDRQRSAALTLTAWATILALFVVAGLRGISETANDLTPGLGAALGPADDFFVRSLGIVGGPQALAGLMAAIPGPGPIVVVTPGTIAEGTAPQNLIYYVVWPRRVFHIACDFVGGQPQGRGFALPRTELVAGAVLWRVPRAEWMAAGKRAGPRMILVPVGAEVEWTSFCR